MSRAAVVKTGFAVTLLLAAFGGSALAQAPAATPASTAPAKAPPPADHSDLLAGMVPAAGPGVFKMEKKGAGLRLTVTGHKFTSRAEIENYLAWRAADETKKAKGTWFTFTEARAKGDTVGAPKRDPNGKHYSFRMENWRPVWRYKMTGDTAWKTWSPYSGVAFFADGKDPKTVTDFEVSADIAVKTGPMDDLNPLAFEAGPVSDLLISQVSPPQ
jgi:hypothetical protein